MRKEKENKSHPLKEGRSNGHGYLNYKARTISQTKPFSIVYCQHFYVHWILVIWMTRLTH